MSSTIESSPVATLTAGDVMSTGVLACPASAPLWDLARIMVVHQVHAVVLAGTTRGVTALDAVRATVTEPIAVAGELASPLVTVDRDRPLVETALVMAEAYAPHVVVPDASGEHVLGVVSSIDIAAALAGRPARLARQVRPRPARPAISTSRLRDVHVRDVMHPGVVSCPPATPLIELAAALVSYHVHCLAVDGRGATVATDMDVVNAVAAGADRLRAEHTGESLPWVAPGETLEDAARLMSAEDTQHLLVGDPSGGATGVLSSLDVLDVVAVGAG